MVRVEAEPRRYTGFAGTRGFNAARKRPATRNVISNFASGDAPDGLDWQTFSAACFPERRRHDLEALTAYGAYRRSHAVEERSAEDAARLESASDPAGAHELVTAAEHCRWRSNERGQQTGTLSS